MNRIITKKHLQYLSEIFRKGIENAKYNYKLTYTILPSFPRGCCELASELLGQFLLDQSKSIPCQIVYGSFYYQIFEDDKYYNTSLNHVWLQVNNYYIDITSDQFMHNINFKHCVELLTPVYVGLNNRFFKSFDIESKTEYLGFNSFSNKNAQNLKEIYQIVCDEINYEW